MTWKVVSTVHGGGKRRDVVSGGIPFLPSIAATNGAQDFLKLSVMFCPEAVSRSGSPAAQIAPIPANSGRAAPSSARPSPPGCPRAAPAVAAAVANGAHAELGVPSKNRGSPVKRSWPRCIGPNMRKADDAARRLSLLVASIRLPG